MAGYNKVILMGNLTRDPELRHTGNGASVATIGLATNRRYTTQAGDIREETLFIDVVAWQKQAETSAEYLKKGRLVLVEGRLALRSWEDEDGRKHSKHEVIADRIQFLPSGNGNGAHAAAGAAIETGLPAEEAVPF